MAFEGLNRKTERDIQAPAGQGPPHRGRTSRRPCGRSAWPCWRPTSATRWSRTLWPRSRSGPSAADVLDSLTPAQQVIKIVNEELIALMGGPRPAKLAIAPKPPHGCDDGGPAAAPARPPPRAKLARPACSRQFGKRPLLVGLRRLPSRRHRAAEGGGRPAGPPGL